MKQHELDDNDARQQQRAETRKGATILFQDKQLRCLIPNLSAEGAELELGDETRLPQHFELSVPHEGVAYRAEVRWREPGRIGVLFNGKELRGRPALKAV